MYKRKYVREFTKLHQIIVYTLQATLCTLNHGSLSIYVTDFNGSEKLHFTMNKLHVSSPCENTNVSRKTYKGKICENDKSIKKKIYQRKNMIIYFYIYGIFTWMQKQAFSMCQPLLAYIHVLLIQIIIWNIKSSMQT